MKLVSIESPFAPGSAQRITYAHQCCLDSLNRGESPYASHLLFPQFLQDSLPEHRELGLRASDEWRKKADLIAFYADHGVSQGMLRAITLAKLYAIPVEVRVILDHCIPAEAFVALGLPIEPNSISYFDPNEMIELELPPDSGLR
jgi:hypothetical protein